MQQANQIRFIKEVAKYFMDFLESDFHKKNGLSPKIGFVNWDIDISNEEIEKIINSILVTGNPLAINIGSISSLVDK